MTRRWSSEVRIREGLTGANLTTFAVGGAVETLLEAASVAGATEIVTHLHNEHQSVKILGAGSNVVLPDEGLSEPIVALGREFNHIQLLTSPLSTSLFERSNWRSGEFDPNPLADLAEGEGIRIFALAATPLMGLSRRLSALGLSGLEFAAGIPATVGGALRMNAGAHGRSIGELVSSVLYLDQKGDLKLSAASEIAFHYRRTDLGEGALVLGVEFALVRGAAEVISEERNRCLEHRRLTQPLHLPSSGSVFRNPSQETVPSANLPSDLSVSAGWLLEQAGLKGLRRGGVEFSPLHANWLVKVDSIARADDVRALVAIGRERVQAEFGIELVPEIVFW